MAMLDEIREITNYTDFLDITIPAAPPLPADEAEANKRVGQLSHYLTLILESFVGFAPLRIPYHMGQGNEAVLGLLLASLEQVNEQAGAITPLFPAEGETYYCEEDLFVLCAWEGDPELVESIGAEFQEDYFNLTPNEIDPSRYGVVIPVVIPEGVDTWEESILIFATRTDEQPVESVSISFTLTTSAEYNPGDPEFTGGGGGLSGGGGASGSW